MNFLSKSDSLEPSVAVHIENSCLTCTSNQTTGFHMNATLSWNGLTLHPTSKAPGSSNQPDLPLMKR